MTSSISTDFESKLRERVRYDPESGLFFRLSGPNPSRWPPGPIRLTKMPKGYLSFRFEGRLLLAHRAAYFLMTSSWPDQIDHRNGEKSDNRWVNLRAATRFENQTNINMPIGRSATRGCHISHNRSKPYRAQIAVNGTKIHIGYFATAKEAADAYKEASLSGHGEFSFFRSRARD